MVGIYSGGGYGLEVGGCGNNLNVRVRCLGETSLSLERFRGGICGIVRVSGVVCVLSLWSWRV